METQGVARLYRVWCDSTGHEHDPYAEGWEAAEGGEGRGDNPEIVGSPAYSLWDLGFVARHNA